jgi:hypothetical protein
LARVDESVTDGIALRNRGTESSPGTNRHLPTALAEQDAVDDPFYVIALPTCTDEERRLSLHERREIPSTYHDEVLSILDRLRAETVAVLGTTTDLASANQEPHDVLDVVDAVWATYDVRQRSRVIAEARAGFSGGDRLAGALVALSDLTDEAYLELVELLGTTEADRVWNAGISNWCFRYLSLARY